MDQEKIWKYYQTESDDIFIQTRPRLKSLTRMFKPGMRVLNVGVGGGVFEEEAVEYGLDVYSLDPIRSALEKVAGRLPLAGKTEVGYSQEMPFDDGFFDGVVMSEVMEHLEDDVLYPSLKEVVRVLKKDGKFVGSVPGRDILKDNFVICPDCGKKFHRWGHVRSFDKSSLSECLSTEFDNVSVEERIFVHWPSLNPVGKIAAVLRFARMSITGKGSGTTLVFQARNS